VSRLLKNGRLTEHTNLVSRGALHSLEVCFDSEGVVRPDRVAKSHQVFLNTARPTDHKNTSGDAFPLQSCAGESIESRTPRHVVYSHLCVKRGSKTLINAAKRLASQAEGKLVGKERKKMFPDIAHQSIELGKLLTPLSHGDTRSSDD
jgi:hypothetical protein